MFGSEMLTRFCDAVPEFSESEATEADVEVELIRLPGSVLTQMNITGSDSWGFLYELASALSLSRFRVLRAIIDLDANDNRVRDVLYVRERNGRPIESQERLQELQLAATLIKQFTHWLPSTGDPHHALARFRELVVRLQPASAWSDNMQSLRRPQRASRCRAGTGNQSVPLGDVSSVATSGTVSAAGQRRGTWHSRMQRIARSGTRSARSLRRAKKMMFGRH